MKRTTILLPPVLKAMAEAQARKLGISFGGFVRTCLEQCLNRKTNHAESDSFFSDRAVFRGVAPRDIAKNHDRYLYGL